MWGPCGILRKGLIRRCWACGGKESPRWQDLIITRPGSELFALPWEGGDARNLVARRAGPVYDLFSSAYNYN
jgi:hypothetical protein